MAPLSTAELISSKVVAEGYKDTPKFNADGDIGAKIASELDIDLSMTDKFSLTVDFGDVMKTEVNWEQLERELAKSLVNSNHEIFQQLHEMKRSSLCVVLESLSCKKDASLDEESDMTEKGKVSANIPKISTVAVDVHMQGEAEEVSHHSYNIPAGTVIAFSCNKLDLTSSGFLSMHVGVDKVDNQEGKYADASDKSQCIKAELAPLVESKDVSDIKAAVMNILKRPQTLDDMLELVATAYCITEDRQSFYLPAAPLSAKFSDVDGWRKLVLLLGFKLPEAITKESKIEFPTEDPKKLVQGCWALLESASELPEEVVAALLQCRANHKEALLSILFNAMEGKDTKYDVAGKIIDDNCKEKTFLEILGFAVIESGEGKCLSLKWKSGHIIRDAYSVIYALL
eukprot:gene13532-4416_t